MNFSRGGKIRSVIFEKIKNLKLTSGKKSVLGMMWRGGKNLLCKLTFDGAFSLAIDIKFRLRRVLASKPPPIEKSTLVPCFRFEMVGGRDLPFPASGNPTARICFAN